MLADLSPIETAKYSAARRAVALVEDGMRIGLGTGSTAEWMLRCLAERVSAEGLRVTGVPTSARTAALARELGLEITSLNEAKWLDLTIDGADQFDIELALIKGGGGALLQEKIVAGASDRVVIIADASKAVKHLGAFPLPIEVVPFGWHATRVLVGELLAGLDVLGRDATLRMLGDQPFVTDEGNYILDLHLGRIGDPRQTALLLNQIPGVIENGLFIDVCDMVIVGHGDGRVEIQDVNSGTFESDMIQFPAPLNVFSGGA